ncbi:Uncharacterised protein [uncultured archaeon]|nr:Uncharacterised protein [uncultured archaeon]
MPRASDKDADTGRQRPSAGKPSARKAKGKQGIVDDAPKSAAAQDDETQKADDQAAQSEEASSPNSDSEEEEADDDNEAGDEGEGSQQPPAESTDAAKNTSYEEGVSSYQIYAGGRSVRAQPAAEPQPEEDTGHYESTDESASSASTSQKTDSSDSLNAQSTERTEETSSAQSEDAKRTSVQESEYSNFASSADNTAGPQKSTGPAEGKAATGQAESRNEYAPAQQAKESKKSDWNRDEGYPKHYLWILGVVVIALVAVLLFVVFSRQVPTCIAASPYVCGNPSISTSGLLTVQAGEIGSAIAVVGLGCSATSSAPSSFTQGNITLQSGTMYSLMFNCQISSNAIDTPFSGTLWLARHDQNGSTVNSLLGTVNLRSVAGGQQASTTILQVNTTPPPPKMHYVTVTLTNSQAHSTERPFQQRLDIRSVAYQKYIDANWTNVEFTTGPAATGNVLQAWVESGASNSSSNTIVWVSLPKGVLASSSTKIYMNFMNESVMSQSGPTGEAPQLSASYGQYDNGASVFETYSNFSGTNLNEHFSKVAGLSIAQNNGLRITSTDGESYYYVMTSYGTVGSVVYDAYVTALNAGNSFNFQEGLVLGSNTSKSFHGTGEPAGSNYMSRESNFGGGYYQIYNGTKRLSSSNFNAAYPLRAIESIAMDTFSVSASDSGKQLSAAGEPKQGFLGLYLYTTSVKGDLEVVNWIRTRSYPPDGAMPSAAFGEALS